jgi:hypothetical protein
MIPAFGPIIENLLAKTEILDRLQAGDGAMDQGKFRGNRQMEP